MEDAGGRSSTCWTWHCKASQEQLQKLYDKAVKEVGEASAAIFEVHQMMLEDEDYLEAIQSMIRTEQVNAEYAVAVTGDNFAEMFASYG
ncbi:MAG: phosphoenolpyruvate-utilizing N-terminal domain-containing protein [Blautia sp.]